MDRLNFFSTRKLIKGSQSNLIILIGYWRHSKPCPL